MKKSISAYFESFGCQMNAFDTEVIASLMGERGIRKADTPEEADVIIVNTCSVREAAENRAIVRLADLSRRKDAVVVACGCMAQRIGEKLFDLIPDLKAVAGPDNYKQLPDVIGDILESGGRATLLGRDNDITYSIQRYGRSVSPSRYLSITRGCENFCTYCIVPYLRGKVRSKATNIIINEIQAILEAGSKEVTLIGQNVMAYRYGGIDFPRLLERITGETDIARVRFLTTHPRDVSEEIFHLMAKEPRICPHIHLPFQAGSNRILYLMNRGYDRERYLEVVRGARRILPDLAFTTDIIVGFPSESDQDFRETIGLVEEVRFDAAFTFKYSARRRTAAAGLNDDVPLEVKKERLRVLNDRIKAIRMEILREQLGSEAEILLDGTVQKGEYTFLKGRTPHFRNVLLSKNDMREGDIVSVVLKELRNFTFVGEKPTRR